MIADPVPTIETVSLFNSGSSPACQQVVYEVIGKA